VRAVAVVVVVWRVLLQFQMLIELGVFGVEAFVGDAEGVIFNLVFVDKKCFLRFNRFCFEFIFIPVERSFREIERK
jgi:hypothetical protein